MTPFEIRLQLLNMAKDLLAEDYHTQKNSLESVWMNKVDCLRQQSGVAMEQIPDYPTMPKFPTEQEIIAKAKFLNDFISNG
jgi:hypothetical protein